MRRMSFSVAVWLLMTFFAAVAPVTLQFSHAGIALATTNAYAKNGEGNGNGNGGGNSGGNGRGGNSDNNGGGGGKGENNGKGNDGRSSGKSSSGRQATGAASDAVEADPSLPGLGVRHAKGITEAIVNGRYVMKDAQGRTIANRPATLADRLRILGLLR